jgi:two-component system capsular synthesis sensor histidine kinase RcsC
MLYGFALLLSATIGSATVLFVSSSLAHVIEEKESTFVRNQERVQSETVRLSSRLMSMVDLYEGNWTFREQEIIPLSRYRDELRRHDGVAVSGADLSATPFLLAVTPGTIQNTTELGTMLHIVRGISAAPAFDLHRDITVSGFVYSPDRSFLAAAPVQPPFDTANVEKQGVPAFIRSQTGRVEPLLEHRTSEVLRAERPIWSSVKDPVHQQILAEIVLPVFRGRQRMATIVATIPTDQFLQYFMRSSRPDGFFVLDSSELRPIANVSRSPTDARLLVALEAAASRLKGTGDTRTVIRHGLTFIVAQRIVGPGWIAVYVFDWKDIANSMRGDIEAALLLCVAALALLWTGVAYFDRRVAKPFERDAEKLVEAEQFNRSIVDTAPVGIAVFDPAQRSIVLENAVARHLLAGPDAAEHRRFYETAVRDRRETALALPDNPTPQHNFFEMRWTSGAGDSYIGVASSATRFRGHDAVLFGLIDITERKAAETMLIEARRAADRANKEKSMFIAIMSHEIRTPVHGVTGHLELLERGELDDRQREHVMMIRRAFDSLDSLIGDLLDATQIEANALTINPQPICLNRVVEHCAQQFAPTVQGRNLALYCYTDPELDRLLEGDDHRLMQILQNLVSNAAKFTQHGWITLSTRLLSHDGRVKWVRIEVADTGIGIPSALQAMVFKPLTQADASISRRFGGSGLGLFLCRSLAELMGGRITLKSEPDVGSVFGIELPLCAPEETEVADMPPLPNVSIDIVSEDRRLAQMLRGRLERWGAKVVRNEDDIDVPDIRIAATDQGEADNSPATTDALPPRFGTIRITPRGPVTPAPSADGLTVTPYSSDTLLSALLTLAGKAASGPGKPVPGARGDASGLDILTAEDDPVNRVLIAHQLEALGFTSVRSANDGREALQMWIECRPDAVITDIGMPYLDGVGLLDEIRRRDPDAFVIATTAAGADDIAPEAATRFSRIMRKPVLLADLNDALQMASASKAPARSGQGRSAAAPVTRVDDALRGVFVESWPREYRSIRQALASRDRNRGRRSLHRLQGALLAMGLDAEAAECLSLQSLCAESRWEALSAKFEELAAALSEIVAANS